jgi:hypothetical protein
MKIKLLTATLAAILCLTACGETATTDNSSEKPADTTTTTAAPEESATESAADEVPTESAPAVETTVTTTTAATTTTEEIPPEPEKEEFKLAEGLSEKYVDFDNMALEFNGHIFRLRESTLQDLIDAGVEFTTDDDLDKTKHFGNRVSVDVNITDTFTAALYFSEPKDTSPTSAREFVLDNCYVHLIQSFHYDVTWGPNYGDGMVHLNIPLVLTMEELIENSGEPLKISNGAASNVKVCDYRGPSLIHPDDSKYSSEISFTFIDDNLASFSLKSHERNEDY